MRMEGKNAYFKSAARHSNFKNAAYSVARRHQRLLCGYLQSDKFFDHALECSPGDHACNHACNSILCPAFPLPCLFFIFICIHTLHISTSISLFPPTSLATEPTELMAEGKDFIEKILEVTK